jgi:diguanylate cyclase (GGDEF)-like protein/PAS domain S-box-containing protein
MRQSEGRKEYTGPVQAWRVYLALGLVVAVLYFFLPPGLGRSTVYNLVAGSSVVAVLVGVRWHSQGRSLPWYLIAASLFCYFLGEVAWSLYEDVLGATPFPSAADVFYLLGYPLFAAALISLIRTRAPGRDWPSLVDASIITTGAAILCWVYLVKPYAGDETLSLTERLLSVAYPLADLLLLAVLARLLVTPGTRAEAYRMLGLGLALFLLGDVVFALASLMGTYESGDLVDVTWVASYLLFGAAALHPSMPLVSETVPAMGSRITWARLAWLAGAALVAPGILAFEAARGRYDEVPVIAAGSAVLFLLVLARLAGLLVRNDRAVVREMTLRTAGAALAAAPEREAVYRFTYEAALEMTRARPGARSWVAVDSGDERLLIAAGVPNGGKLDMAELPDRMISSLLAMRCTVVDGADAAVVLNLLCGESYAPGHGSVFVCPLVVGDRVRGAILVADQSGLPPETRSALEALGSQASLALEGVILSEELHVARGEERFRALVQNSTDIITILDPEGVVRFESPAAETVLGYRPGERLGEHAMARIHPGDVERVSEAFASLMANPGSTLSLDCRMRHADGSWRDMETAGTNLLSHPVVRGVVINARDVTRRREAENRYRTLVENVPAIVYIQSFQGEMTTLYDSPRITDLLGYPPDTYERNPDYWLDVVHPEDRERVLAEERLAAESRCGFRMEYRVIAADGRVMWVRDEAAVVEGALDRSTCWQGFIFDITERKELEEELQHQAFHDRLTGLPNRALFMDRLQHALVRVEREDAYAALLFLDLDNFKVINDSLGHATGDRLLISVAERLESCVRARDTVCRLGGDEFVFLLEDAKNTTQATQTAQRVLDALREPFIVDDDELFVVASIGIVLGASSDERPDDLLRKADLAMYRAKRRGKARYEVFDRTMNERALRRLRMETDLRRAIGNGELSVHYQPKVSLRDRKIVGMEALARWEHPGQGMVFPDEFIPVAEETGLIFPLGLLVLREACAQACLWNAARPKDEPLRVNVNLSARQFNRPDLVENVARVLDDTGLEPGNLVLEITESVVMGDVDAAIATLKKLKILGVRVALDDFGTGYSSLSYLKRFPVDYLKIDKSFVDGLGQDPEDRGIVASVVDLAHTLGLEAVAEGVETAEQLAHLQTLHCELAQGFLFHKPLPAEAASLLLA